MIQRDLFTIALYSKNTQLSFTCPNCNLGHIKVSASEITKNDIANEILRFVALPSCSVCNDSVTITGTARYYNEFGHPAPVGYINKKYLGFTPVFFIPPINIFPISQHCPLKIKDCIVKGFSHYWNDLSASANRIRTAVEFIMDEQGVAPASTLHARITSYRNINEQCSSRLMAVKWIGNTGSHSDIITQEEVLDGFELLESVIEILYHRPNENYRLDLLSEGINNSRGNRI